MRTHRPNTRSGFRKSAALSLPIFILLGLCLFLTNDDPSLPNTEPTDRERADRRVGGPAPVQAAAEAPETILVNGLEVPANEPVPIVRGANNRLFYPEAVILERKVTTDTVFNGAVLAARAGEPAGPLTVDEHTSSAIEAAIDPQAVWRFVESDAEFIEIPLSDDRNVLVRVEKIVERGGRTHTLLGKVRGEPLSDVLLVFHDGALSGSIAFMGRDEHYQFAMAGNGDAAIRLLNSASFTAVCGDPGDPVGDAADELEPEGGEEGEGEIQPEPPAGSLVMDTVIGYGAEARAAQGGTAAMEAKVIEGVDRLNAAINNSLIDSSFVSLLASVEDPDYDYPGGTSGTMGSGDELGDLNNTGSSNPELNTISDLRIALGADHNGFIIKSTDGSAGVAYRPGRSMLVARTYITSTRLTFAHEFGHNVGCSHSWGDTSGETSTSLYRWGWRLDPPTSSRVRTIMAYDWDWGNRIPYFANPAVEFNGARTGQVDGYNATGDSESDSRYVSGGYTGSAGTGFNGSNPDLGARNADYFEERDTFLADNATRTALAVFDPNSGDSWQRGSSYTIFWYGGDHTDTTQLDLYKGGAFQYTIASGFDAHLRWYQWSIPGGQTLGSDYRIRLTLNGTIAVESNEFTIAEANAAPTDLALTPSDVDENVPSGTTVGTLSTTDVEGGPFTYSLVSGTGSTDNALFAIDGSTLETAGAINYEIQSTRQVRIRTTDPAGGSYEEAFVITINDVFEIPTTPKLVRKVVSGVSSSGWTAVDLGQSYTSPVVVATPIYPDGAFVPMVARVRNASGSGCELRIDRVDGLTGAVSCDVSIIAVEEGVYNTIEHGVNMEAVTYVSTLTAENGNWTGESRNYQNAYTSPVVVGQVMTAVDDDWSVFWCYGSSRENPPDSANLRVGKTVCEDPDATRANETIGYIVIEAGTGTIEGISYSAGVGADSVGGYGNSSTGFYYPVSGLSSAGAAALALAGMDGADGGWGVLFGSNALTPSALNVLVAEDQLNDSDISHTNEQLAFLVIDAPPNSAPTDITLSNGTISENESVGTEVGSLGTVDAEGGSFGYLLVSGSGSADNASFSISGNSLRSAITFDREIKDSYSVRIRTTDSGGLTYEKVFAIGVIDVPEAPTAIGLSPDDVDENEPSGTPVGTLSTTDPEGGGFVYALVSGTGSADNGSFSIVGDSVRTAASFDHEGKDSYSIRIRSTDSTALFFERTFTISVNNLLEPPSAPTGLLATGGAGSISLSWNDVSNNETGFRIERSATGGGSGFSAIHTTAAGETGYVDGGLADGTEFHYRVVATGLEGDSAPSGESSATTLAALAAWRSDNGLAPDGSEDESDGDLDGLPALVEFALKLDPDAADVPSPVAGEMVDDNGETYFVLRFPRRIGGTLVDNAWQVDGISYRVEVSSSLAAWDSSTDSVEWLADPVDQGNGTEIVTCRVKDPEGESVGGGGTSPIARFARLVVEELP